MTDYVCDYAWARPPVGAIVAGGFKGVCRYLSHDRTGKTLTKAEAESYLAVGLGVILNFEDSAGHARSGFSAGKADAQFANQLADQLGAPGDAAIYYSVDTDPGSGPDGVIQEYVHGLTSVPGRPVGVYGGAVLVRWALSNGCRYGWTANARSWDHGVAPQGHLHQLYSHPAGTATIPGVDPQAYDTSVIFNPNAGAWGGTLGSSAPAPAPKPAPQQEDDDDVSGSFWYALDKFRHRVWVARVATNHAKVGDVLHLYGLPDAQNPAGKVENLTQKYAPHLGPQDHTQPVEFAVRPDSFGSIIDGTTVDATGAITRWEWSPVGTTWSWRPVPYFPA